MEMRKNLKNGIKYKGVSWTPLPFMVYPDEL